MLIKKEKKQSFGYCCSPSQYTRTLLSISASCTQRANLAIGELDGPTQATNESTQLDGVQIPKRSVTSPGGRTIKGLFNLSIPYSRLRASDAEVVK